ncbi:GumC family protein [Pontibacter liquoris]|uniref:GumC family protein n=1 Tax=Pontibacter liquoris TaxID=2905677 RepID=UPI001FA6F30D|nr:tyrosine-protein kinase family protein [Pontibacter liquoris]
MASSENNLLSTLVYKYLPFWPLFALLLTFFSACAWGYMNYYSIPVYESSATLIIKDEKKGVNDSRMTESIDAFTSNKIVENEIKVLYSRALMKQVVKYLRLYAPVYEEGKFKTMSAYTTSPVQIKVKSPDKLKEVAKVYFTIDKNRNKIKIGDKEYPLREWVQTPYGIMKFTSNPKRTALNTDPLFFSLIKPKKVTEDLLENLSIEAENKLSTVVNLKLYDPVPERGEEILNTLIHTYNEVAVNERNKLAANTLSFVEDRIKLVEKELDVLENEVVKYKSRKGVVNLSEQGKLFLNNVGDTDRKISELNLQLAVLDKVERYVISKNNSAGIVPSTLGINDPVLSQLLEKLYNSEIEYQKLKKTTAENNPILVSITDEIEKIRPSILENIGNQRSALLASRANLTATNNQYQTVLQTIPQKERELLEISRQQAIKNDAYSFLLQKREETVLSYAPTAGDTRIVDMAESSLLPVSPRPLHVYLIAVVLAFFSGIAMVMGKELMNGKLLFRSEIEEHTHAPIVAELSLVKQPKASLFLKPTEVTVIEQFRQLRATLGLYGRTFTKKKIMITSSIPGEGKSFVSTNLAYSLASSGKKVVLVDCDLRNPRTSQLFDLYQQTGLTEYLEEDIQPQNIIYDTPFSNLSVVAAGINIGDNTELLLNGRLEVLFTYLEDAFDYIIIDTPPLELVSDAYLLSEFCDMTLLVMRHAYTPKNLVQRLGQDHKLRSLYNVAIVFNGVKPRGFVKGQYGYGYGYGHDFKYGDKTYRNRSIKTGA